jgi:hypothetical protein
LSNPGVCSEGFRYAGPYEGITKKLAGALFVGLGVKLAFSKVSRGYWLIDML